MEVSNTILRKYNDINGFNPRYINKDILYSYVGMLYLDGISTDEIDEIVKDIKNNPYNYLEKSSDFNKILADLNVFVHHYDLNRDDYQILTDAFDREAPYFIHMNKNNDFIIVENRLRDKYYRYLDENKW